MNCPKCEKEYEDSFAFCPHCGEQTPEPTKDCPYCNKVIKAEAVKCRYCHSDLTKPFKKPKKKRHPLVWVKGNLTKKRVAILGLILVLVVALSLGALGLLRLSQKGHYKEGQEYLSSQKYYEAAEEFKQAGGYSNASDLAFLTTTYNQALVDMGGHQWQEAYELLKEVRDKGGEFQEVAGKIDYIERCPQTPVYYSLNSNSTSVKVNNLLGEEIGAVGISPAWTYSNHSSPNLISTVRLTVSPGGGITLAASGQSRYQKDGYTLLVPGVGQQFDLDASQLHYHFIVSNVGTISRPNLGDGGYGNDPVFSRLSLTIEVSPR